MQIDENEVVQYEICPSCEGGGTYDIGNCEDGIVMPCPECDGFGEVPV